MPDYNRGILPVNLRTESMRQAERALWREAALVYARHYETDTDRSFQELSAWVAAHPNFRALMMRAGSTGIPDDVVRAAYLEIHGASVSSLPDRQEAAEVFARDFRGPMDILRLMNNGAALREAQEAAEDAALSPPPRVEQPRGKFDAPPPPASYEIDLTGRSTLPRMFGGIVDFFSRPGR
jgi:hypothetical protein